MRPVDILLVEDDAAVRSAFVNSLSSVGFHVASASDGLAALAMLRKVSPTIVLSDLNMPRMTGYEFLSIVRRRMPDIRIVAMSGSVIPGSPMEILPIDHFYAKGEAFDGLVAVLNCLAEGTPSVKRPIAATAFQALNSEVLRRNGELSIQCMDCFRTFMISAQDDGYSTTSCVHCGALVTVRVVRSGTLGLLGSPMLLIRDLQAWSSQPSSVGEMH